MANFTAADIKKLRELTGAGMMDCKKALDEADGDFDKAVEILRVKGLKGVTKREGRTATNGLVAAELDGTAAGALLELNCETDFVAKGEQFQQVAARSSSHVVATNAGRRRRAARARPRATARPCRQFVDEANATLGEKIELRRFAQFVDDGYVAAYLHKTSPDLPPQVGVLVELDGRRTREAAKDIAQHIAALRADLPHPRRGPGRRRRERAPARRGDRPRGGQARGCAAEDRRGPGQRLLQGQRAARAGVREGQKKTVKPGPRRGRRRPSSASPASASAPDASRFTDSAR